jgi:hypothetical protein
MHALLALLLALGGITVAVPSWGNPAGPDEPATIRIEADVPPHARAEVTIKANLGITHPLCRPVDAPDPEFKGWLVCSGGAGPWTLELTVPRATLRSPACPVNALSVPYNVAVDGRRIGEAAATIVTEACYRAYLPMLERP